MEQHPVPQNVTTFQFRLIGDMTLKQFGYLCAGAILAFIAYKLPMPFIITWPLTMAFAFLGIGFAFIPIEERPMDVWVFSFFKSIYSPTQYLWTREAPTTTHPAPAATIQPPAASPAAQQAVHPAPSVSAVAPNTPPKIPTVSGTPHIIEQSPSRVPAVTGMGHPIPPPLPQQTPPQTHQPPAAPAKTVLSDLFQQQQHIPPAHHTSPVVTTHIRTSWWQRILEFFAPRPKTPVPVTMPKQAQAVHPVAAPPPSVTGLRPVAPPIQEMPATPVKPDDHVIHQKMARLEENIASLEARLKTSSTAEDRVLELQKQLTDLLEQKSKTDDELSSLKRSMLTKPEPQAPHSPGQPVSSGSVNVITTQEAAVKAGLPRLTNVPNVITGIVKDDGGNLLPGILVTVTNNDGVPMRALKTNKLGQFAASTPLAAGTYFVEIEDPRNRFTFSRVQITLSGGVLPILEILAKSEKILTREKLTKEIFGTPNA